MEVGVDLINEKSFDYNLGINHGNNFNGRTVR